MSENEREFLGLSSDEVRQRISDGKVNVSTNVKTKSIKRICIDNSLGGGYV